MVRGVEGRLEDYESQLHLSPLALDILKLRYLNKDDEGNIIETPFGLFLRVAKNIASVDKRYERTNFKNTVLSTTHKFLKHLVALDFVPASPILMNAGNSLQSLFSDHALDVPDSMEDIFEVLKMAATIQQKGGGVGFSFSKIRPHHDKVKGMKDVAFGPINVMHIFDTSFSAIIQGGRRAGANMSILHISHPDIEEFISIKSDSTKMKNFNLSVAVTREFMQAVIEDNEFNLINPRNQEIHKTIRAKELFEAIATQAWATGDPGLIFIDEMNDAYPFLKSKVLCTGACGQYELENFEGVPYAHINLAKMISSTPNGYVLDEKKLAEVVGVVVHFLDNCIDAHDYSYKEIEEKTKGSRKIGLGLMGFADLLFFLGIPYDSKQAFGLIKKIMSILKAESRIASNDLAKTRGAFPRFKETKWSKLMRNATITSIAPTGTTSLIASASQSIEPVYALSFTNKTSSGQEFTILNKAFQDAVDALTIDRTAKIQLQFVDSVQNISWLDSEFKEVFKTAMDIVPLDHLRVMAAFQEFVDNSISKTINLPNETTVQEVINIYLEAWKLKCKGITIYRDGCRFDQVLGTKTQTRLYAFDE